MTVALIILGIFSMCVTLFGITYFSRYRQLKEEYLIKGRKGYYVHHCFGKSFVYVQEIERYNNGMSKIKLLDIEFFEGSNSDKSFSIENARNTFTSIRKTCDIEWLELNVKDMRKEKIKEIEKKLK